MRGTLKARGESDSTLDAMAPGGAENQTAADSFGAAVVWYSLLRGRLAFLTWKDELQQQRGQAALSAALANAPVPLTLSSGEKRAVYPKSFHALAWCDALDRALDDVSTKTLALHEIEVTVTAPPLVSLAVRLWAWILTCPEPGLPFEEGAPSEPPGWTEALSPEDILAILRAHYECNRERVALVATLFPTDRQAESKLSLSGFLGTVAQEMGHRPSDVLTRWSLGEAFAQAVVTAEAAREARARAEEERS